MKKEASVILESEPVVVSLEPESSPIFSLIKITMSFSKIRLGKPRAWLELIYCEPKITLSHIQHQLNISVVIPNGKNVRFSGGESNTFHFRIKKKWWWHKWKSDGIQSCQAWFESWDGLGLFSGQNCCQSILTECQAFSNNK